MPRARLLALALGLAAPPAVAQTVDYGDDSGSLPRDEECDDRRIFGPGVAKTLDWTHVGRDTTD